MASRCVIGPWKTPAVPVSQPVWSARLPELPIAGICSILKTNGNSADVGLIVEQAGILMSFGEVPKANARMTEKPHSTRMGLTAVIRETLMKAQDYYAAKQSKKVIKDREIDMEALIPLIRGEVPMRACAHRAEDIMAAIRIAEESSNSSWSLNMAPKHTC